MYFSSYEGRIKIKKLLSKSCVSSFSGWNRNGALASLAHHCQASLSHPDHIQLCCQFSYLCLSVKRRQRKLNESKKDDKTLDIIESNGSWSCLPNKLDYQLFHFSRAWQQNLLPLFCTSPLFCSRRSRLA